VTFERRRTDARTAVQPEFYEIPDGDSGIAGAREQHHVAHGPPRKLLNQLGLPSKGTAPRSLKLIQIWRAWKALEQCKMFRMFLSIPLYYASTLGRMYELHQKNVLFLVSPLSTAYRSDKLIISSD